MGVNWTQVGLKALKTCETGMKRQNLDRTAVLAQSIQNSRISIEQQVNMLMIIDLVFKLQTIEHNK